MFLIGDKVVHPMHGAGIIEDFVTRSINDENAVFYSLKLILTEMTIFIPVNSSSELGLRPILSKEDAYKLIESIPDICLENEKIWNRRYRENMLKMCSGDLKKVLCVVKNLSFRFSERGLSTGEKKMLTSAKHILISELVLSLNQSFEDVSSLIDFAFRSKNVG